MESFRIECMGCSITIGNSYFNKSLLPSSIKDWYLITDSTLYSLYASELESWGFPIFYIPAGESSKSRENKEKIEDWLITQGCKRNSGLIAFGGGMIGDITGFVASTYMRGISFTIIPTSLLSMIDSSIGGKTGLDTPSGKNLIGTIWQPAKVIIDTHFLDTLKDPCLWAAGMAEILKISSMIEPNLWTMLQKYTLLDLQNNPEDLVNIIYHSVKAKVDIVQSDVRENSVRAALNFGHTIGHAVEAVYNGIINHGNCIGFGTIKELEICEFLGIKAAPPSMLKAVLQQYQAYSDFKVDWNSALEKMKSDKKRVDSNICFAVPTILGANQWKLVYIELKDIEIALSSSIHIKSFTPKMNTIEIPGSKSITNRVLLLASLTQSTTVIKGVLQSDDTVYMAQALKDLGLADIHQQEEALIITGKRPDLSYDRYIYVGNAGTVARFLTAIAVYLPFTTTIDGDSRMNERPIRDLVDSINTDNRIEYLKKEGSTPIRIKGGSFLGGEIAIKSKTSSQYVSALLMVSPLAESPTTIVLSDVSGDSRPTSESYIEMTIQVMRTFGVQVTKLSDSSYFVRNSGYSSPGEIEIDPDACSASYFFAIAALNSTEITVNGIQSLRTQGEFEFLSVIREMGCEVIQNTEKNVTVKGRDLKAVDVDMSQCTDSFLTAAVIMATIQGVSRIRGIANQRVKECNRIEAIIRELRKIGVNTIEHEDGLEIEGRTDLNVSCVNTYNDHRIAMAFAVLGTRIPLNVKQPQVVSKTFPDFWKTFKNSGGNLKKGQKINNLVLIGMRGAGKSTFGKRASEHLGWNFIDLDSYISKEVGEDSLLNFVNREGMGEFRRVEFKCLCEVLNKERTVLALGGGIIDYSDSLDLLCDHSNVIWIKTPIENIIFNLENDSSNLHRVKDDVRATYLGRVPSYDKACDYIYYYKKRNNFEIFDRFIGKVLKKPVYLPNDFSSFLSIGDELSVPENPEIQGIELRADLIENIEENYLYFYEEHSKKQLIITLRTKAQFGSFEGDYWDCIFNLARYAPDLIDIEYTPSVSFMEKWIQFRNEFPNQNTILSYHSTNPENYSQNMVDIAPEILKYISPLNSRINYSRFIHFTLDLPYTRVKNTYFSPLRLGDPMGKGQLSYEELVHYQKSLGVRPDSFKFYLIGSNISLSPGPRVFNAMFNSLNLPYQYELLQVDQLETSHILEKTCLGGSVTMPFKQEIRQYLDYETETARKIGSVNTLVKSNGKLIGTNTDWIGIYAPLKRHRFNTCCILGAGGTSKAAVYAARKLNCKRIVIWNRTPERLQGFSKYETTTNLEDISAPDLLISTLPHSVIPPFIQPSVVVFDVSLYPVDTELVLHAKSIGCTVYTGIDMWAHQAHVQAQLFTGLHVTIEELQRHL